MNWGSLNPSQKRTAIAALIGLAVGAMVLLNRARTGQPLGGGSGVVDSSGQLVTDGYAGSSTFADNGQALGQLNSTITELIGQQTVLQDQLDDQGDKFNTFIGSQAAQTAEANAARAAQQAQFDAALSSLTASQQAAAAQPAAGASVAAAAAAIASRKTGQKIPAPPKQQPAATTAQLNKNTAQGVKGSETWGGTLGPDFHLWDAPGVGGKTVVFANAPAKRKTTNSKTKKK